MTHSTYFNCQGMAKICHDPCYDIGNNMERYAIWVLPNMGWEPVRLHLCFPARDAAEVHLAKVYPKMELVKEAKFDALCRNLYVLPQNFSNFSNCG